MKPRIVAIAAMTIDGKIARSAGHFTDWTSPEDKTFLRWFLDQSDVVVVGNTTYKTAVGPLSKRNCIVFTRDVRETERRGENLCYFNPAGTLALGTLLEPYRTVAVLGGTQTYSYFLENRLLDNLYLTVEPVIFGTGLNLFEGKEGITAHFDLIDIRRLNQKGSVLLYYQRPS